MSKKWMLMMIMAVMLSGMTRAAQWQMREYDDQDGLSQWHITKILQDRHGYMWFATWNGLNRFDGYEFAVFKSHPGDGTGVASDIRSTNADGLAVNNIKSIVLVVEPTLWETSWARCIYLLLVALIFAVTYTFFYIRTLKRQRKENYDKYMRLINGGEDDSHEHRQDLTDDDHLFMKRLTAFVASNLSDSAITIDAMAAATATSRSSLNRKTKHLLGVTPADFLREARMKKASRLLLTSGDSINDIAYACGFSDAKYFSKCFKASRGLSPSEYRTAEKG